MKAQGQIIGLELAKLARKAGFNEITDHAHCFDTIKKGHYISYDPDYFVNSELWDQHFAAPTQEQLHAWLRSTNRIVVVNITNKLQKNPSFYAEVYACKPIWKNIYEESNGFASYEAAFEDGLKIAIGSLL